jgi:hypothetical protein
MKILLTDNLGRAGIALRRVIFSIISGIVIGCVGVAFIV